MGETETLAVILIIILMLILAVILSFLFVNLLTGFSINNINNNTNQYTYTKAICDTEKCQDYVIVCDGNELVNINPITGAFIEIDSDWKDPRPEKVINNFCNR